MDNRDRQIAILNCNTVAASLISNIDHATVLDVIDAYEAAFDAVWRKVQAEIGGENILATVNRVFPDSVLVDPTPVAPQTSGAPTTVTSNIQVVGAQHGSLPAWLVQQCEAAGISKVYDNRVDRDGNDITTNPINKRPWFKAADGSDKAFWPPKTGRR